MVCLAHVLDSVFVVLLKKITNYVTIWKCSPSVKFWYDMFVLLWTGGTFTSKHICFSISPESITVRQRLLFIQQDLLLTYAAFSFYLPCKKQREHRGMERKCDEGRFYQLMLLLLISQCPSNVYLLPFLINFNDVSVLDDVPTLRWMHLKVSKLHYPQIMTMSWGFWVSKPF